MKTSSKVLKMFAYLLVVYVLIVNFPLESKNIVVFSACASA
jgi:hypothetical protein